MLGRANVCPVSEERELRGFSGIVKITRMPLKLQARLADEKTREKTHKKLPYSRSPILTNFRLIIEINKTTD